MPEHWSYSQWADFSGCGHRYKLKRVDGITGTPSVASVAGRAFHRWTEVHDLGDMPEGTIADTWQDTLNQAVEDEYKATRVPPGEWRVGGRTSREKPNREDLAYWLFFGVQLCEKYLLWAAGTQWEIDRHLPPDYGGRTKGIEYELNTTLAGHPFKGYVDRITFNEKGQRGIVDYKTGSRMRHTIQLGHYAAALATQGIQVSWGASYNARKGEATEPVDLTSWTPEKVAQVMAPQQFMRDNGIYPIVPGDHCDYCPVRRACEYHL